jgi:hypothetical protein
VGAPTIYYCEPDFDRPSGGMRVAYRHVDLLNSDGLEARVLHHDSEFRCTWFEHETRVVGASQTRIGPQDLLVVGELAVSLLEQLPPGFRYVVFNQNQHLTWRRASVESVHRYTHDPGLAAILTVSDYGREALAFMAPEANVVRVHNSINPQIFFCDDDPAQRPPTIAYMPRRGGDEARQVLGLLRNRGALEGWDVLEVDGVSELEVGDLLRRARVFLSFSYQEGFGLPAAEAMACGAYVLGFHGYGGREFFGPEWSTAIEGGDVLGFAQAVQELLACERREPGWCGRRGVRGASFIATHYSPERERADVLGAFQPLSGGV